MKSLIKSSSISATNTARELFTNNTNVFIRVISAGIRVMIRGYQMLFSPDHGIFRGLFGYSRCRFYPTCSEYAITSLRQYGLLKGGVVSLWRVVRCGPWSAGGYDPVQQ